MRILSLKINPSEHGKYAQFFENRTWGSYFWKKKISNFNRTKISNPNLYLLCSNSSSHILAPSSVRWYAKFLKFLCNFLSESHFLLQAKIEIFQSPRVTFSYETMVSNFPPLVYLNPTYWAQQPLVQHPSPSSNVKLELACGILLLITTNEMNLHFSNLSHLRLLNPSSDFSYPPFWIHFWLILTQSVWK